MGSRVEFFRLGREGRQDQRLFSIVESDGRLVACGPELADAVVVLRHEVEVAERKIRREQKPLDWIAALPLAYERDALAAAAPLKDERTLLEIVTSSKTLLAFKSVKDYFYFESAAIRDIHGAPVSFSKYLRAVESEEWEQLVPPWAVLEALSPRLPAPSLDEIAREFFFELERWRREYSNWDGIYKRPEVWDKVLFGTPEVMIPQRAAKVDRGLWGRVGERFYPRVGRYPLAEGQLWRVPLAPGAREAKIAAALVHVQEGKDEAQLLLDLAALRVPTKVLMTRLPVEKMERRSKELHDLARKEKLLVEGERLFIVIGPPATRPRGPWGTIKSDPAGGEPWLLSEWG